MVTHKTRIKAPLYKHVLEKSNNEQQAAAQIQ